MAGLLDYLFNSGTYDSGAGGLFSRIQPMLGQIPQSAGFTPQNNQPSPLDTAQWPAGPVGAPSSGQIETPPNAQPAQGQQPQQLPPAFGPNPSGAEGFRQGFSANTENGLFSALAGGLAGAAGLRAPAAPGTRELFQAYQGAGLTPNQAMLATINPKLAENLLGIGGTDDIKEYQFAKRENPSLTFDQFMQKKKSVSGEYGMTPIWGTGPDGNPAVLQLGKSGDAKQSVLPPGFNLSRDPIKVDGPTGTTILDPQTRQQVGFIPKDVAGKEAAEKRGQAQGTAQAALANGADIDAERTVKKIQDLIDHEGLSSIFGPLDQYRGSTFLGEKGRDALTRFNSLKGTAFLQAYTMLRGGGAITEIEGKKAEEAIARLDRSLSEDDAKAALKDFKEAVDVGLMKLKRAAAGGGELPTAPASSAPKRIRINADGTLAQ